MNTTCAALHRDGRTAFYLAVFNDNPHTATALPALDARGSSGLNANESTVLELAEKGFGAITTLLHNGVRCTFCHVHCVLSIGLDIMCLTRSGEGSRQLQRFL